MIKRLKLSMKSMLALVLIVCLILPQAALAEEVGGLSTTPKGSFSDTNTHWAKKHISKISLLGFAQGDTSGQFNPNSPISQQEAVIMLVNMMGKKDQVNMNSEANLSFEVAAWAKPYVVLALSEKLITMKEELDNTVLNWGAKSATREWITKLVVRAIGQQAQADLAQDDDTGFTDANLIGDDYAGYINIAQSLDIVNGYVDGTFNPVGNITRAEMAVILGEAEQHLATRSSMIATGTVVSVNLNTIEILETSGLIKTYNFQPDAGIYNKGSNSAISAASISIDDYVTIIHDQVNAYYVEISDEQVVMESFVGTMESISMVDYTISLNINGVLQSFRYAQDNVQVTNGVKGLSLSELTIGSTLELKRNSESISTDITQIIVKAAPVFKTVVGTVQNIQTINQIVEVTETSTGETVAYSIPSTIVITNGARTLGSLNELYLGDGVTIELKDNIVTSFVVTKSSIVVEEGIVNAVDAKGEKIFLSAADNKLIGYFIGKDVKVNVTGLTGATLSDIQENDEVLIELNGNNLVTKITVKNRTINTKRGLSFFDYDADAKVVYLKTDLSQKAEAYEINEKTVLSVGHTAVTLATLSTYFTKGKKVDITYTGERIIAMGISTYYEGELISIDSLTKAIKLNSDLYGELSVSYAYAPYVEMFGKPNASLSDLKVGDKIQIQLDTNQDKAISIRLFSTHIYKVLIKSTNKLTVSGATTSAAEIYNVTSVPVSHHNKLFATYADIKEDMYIEATMAGTSTTSIYIPEVTTGKLTAINPSQGSLTIEGYGSGTKTISTGISTTVVKDSVTSTSLNAAAVNDRAQVVVGKNGASWITVFKPVKKNFIAYTDSSKTVQLSVTQLNDPNKFVLADNAYIHKGTQVLNIKSLVRNDQIMVYMLNNIIVEIEKL